MVNPPDGQEHLEVTLDPGHAKARAELDRLEITVDDRQSRTRAVAGAGGVLLLGVIGILLFGGRRRARKPSRAA